MRGPPGNKLTLESTFSPTNAMLNSLPASGANSRKSSTHLTPNFDAISMDGGGSNGLFTSGPTPSVYGSTLCQPAAAAAPCRRTSIGPADNGGRSTTRSPMIDHRKCSSVDSSGHHSLAAPKPPSQTAVCAASLGMYTLGLIDPKNTLSPLFSDKPPSLPLNAAAAMRRDSHSSSCLIDKGDAKNTLSPSFSDKPPLLLNAAASMRRDSHSSSCLIDKVERKNGSTTPTGELRRDPGLQRSKASSIEILKIDASTSPGSKMPLRDSAAVLVPQPPPESQKRTAGQESPKEQLSRRLERRYFTADAIETMKPKTASPGAGGNGESGILKRFSWTTDPNNNQHYLKHKKFQTTLAGKVNGGQCNIERSASTNSNKGSSYCSSSGVSSSSLSNSGLKCGDETDSSSNILLDDPTVQDSNHSPTILEDESGTMADDRSDTNDDSPTTKNPLIVPKLDVNGLSIDDEQKRQSLTDVGRHVSTVSVGGCADGAEGRDDDDDDGKERELIMAAHDMIKNATVISAPKIEKQTPSVKTNAKSAKEQLLKFIMDTHLEASDV
uniref:Uncharacterized protein n=1 Tax=Romanomermis culicivorax TaxID=13658 RepID=A0A915JWN9_ROMCU